MITALVALARDVGLAGLPLRVEAVDPLLAPFLAGITGVDQSTALGLSEAPTLEKVEPS
jgi:hypothetical protein